MDKDGVHYWSTQVDFYNKVNDKRVTGLAKVYMQGQDRFRMDVMDPFGFVKIGTVVVNQGQAKVNFMKQAPYEGPVYDGMFKQLLKADVSMRDFLSLFTQANISKNDWSCKNDSDGIPEICANEDENLLINWSGSMKEPGTNCKVTHPRADIALRVKGYKFFDQPKERLFLL
jgi:hypothetical protein